MIMLLTLILFWGNYVAVTPPLNPVNLNYIDLNETGDPSAQVLFFVHGSSSTKETWLPIIENLKSQYRIVAIDLRGHGESPMSLDSHYSLEEMVADVHSVVEKLKLKKIIFVAHSMGVRIVIPYTAKHQDRVKALILEDHDVRPAKKPVLPMSKMEELKSFKIEHSNIEEAKQELIKFGYNESRVEGYSKDGRIELRENESVKIKIHPYVRYIIRRYISASDKTQEYFKKIPSIPKLLLRAEKNSYATDQGVAEMLKVDPKLKVVKIPDSDHTIHASHTEDFINHLNEFIDSLD